MVTLYVLSSWAFSVGVLSGVGATLDSKSNQTSREIIRRSQTWNIPYEYKGMPLTALYPHTQPKASSVLNVAFLIIPDYAYSAELLIILETMPTYWLDP